MHKFKNKDNGNTNNNKKNWLSMKIYLWRVHDKIFYKAFELY